MSAKEEGEEKRESLWHTVKVHPTHIVLRVALRLFRRNYMPPSKLHARPTAHLRRTILKSARTRQQQPSQQPNLGSTGPFHDTGLYHWNHLTCSTSSSTSHILPILPIHPAATTVKTEDEDDESIALKAALTELADSFCSSGRPYAALAAQAAAQTGAADTVNAGLWPHLVRYERANAGARAHKSNETGQRTTN